MINKVLIPQALAFFFIFLITINIPVTESFEQSYSYDPQDFLLEDNIYYLTDYFSLQWWYIDAVFDNNHSIHIGSMTVGSKGKYGFFLFRINLYKDGLLLEKKSKIVPVIFVEFSQDKLLIKLNGKEILNGYIDNNNRMVLDVSLEIRGLEANLKLIGLTKGWKGDTGHGWWSCPLPKAMVNGTITVNNEIIPVNGTGYQEHGWDVQRLHKNWYWGKFTSNNSNVIFSQNMKNKWEEDIFIVVVNYGEENYSSIARENIVFDHQEYTYNHGRLIPIKSNFQINDDDININVEIEVQSIHFSSLIFMNHWRLHTKVTGTITIGNYTENIKDFQIMEIFYFP